MFSFLKLMVQLLLLMLPDKRCHFPLSWNSNRTEHTPLSEVSACALFFVCDSHTPHILADQELLPP